MRLKARAVVFEAAGQSGARRIALVQADLGAVSPLLHELVAARTAQFGLDRARLLLAATHTHGGPAGHMPDPFYSSFGGARPGFDEEFTRHLAELLARAVHLAVRDLRPATLAFGSESAPNLSYNRSYSAWIANGLRQRCNGASSVDIRIPVLRIDQIEGTRRVPRAVVTAAAVHGTAVGPTNDLYHPDLFGYAAYAIKRELSAKYGARVVPLVFAGAEGDSSPLPIGQQGFAKAEVAGEVLAKAALAAWEEARTVAAEDVGFAYHEVDFRNANTSEGATCERARIGVPTIGGAEDGRSSLYGQFGVFEGRLRAAPGDCQSPKVSAFGVLQRAISAGRYSLEPPNWAPFQVLRIGSIRVVAVPGEPTRQVGGELERRAGRGSIVVGLANGYVGYFATSREYSLQQYEGSSTFWGPTQAALAYDTVADLAGQVFARQQQGRPVKFRHRTYKPWLPRSFVDVGVDCSLAAWEAVSVENSGFRPAVFTWRGEDENDWCASGTPSVSVICDRTGPRRTATFSESDDAGRIEVRNVSGHTWKATWDSERRPDLHCCRFVVSEGMGKSLVESEAFYPRASGGAGCARSRM